MDAIDKPTQSRYLVNKSFITSLLRIVDCFINYSLDFLDLHISRCQQNSGVKLIAKKDAWEKNSRKSEEQVKVKNHSKF